MVTIYIFKFRSSNLEKDVISINQYFKFYFCKYFCYNESSYVL